MLWYKAWRESRTRFLISVAVLILYCAAVVVLRKPLTNTLDLADRFYAASYIDFVRGVVFDGAAKGLFTFLVLFLGLGGLLREKVRGTSTFTLSLPVSRLRIARTRAAVGLLEMTILALSPALVVLLLSALLHKTYPISQALRFTLLWVVGGAAIFALAFLLSSISSGEFTAAVAGFIILILHSLAALWAPLRPYHLNIMQTMGGWRMLYRGPDDELLLGSLPTLRLLVPILVATVMFIVSLRLTQRKDF